MNLTLSDFDYDLPPELIAQSPISPRDHSRLMKIDRSTGTISHHHFYDLPDLIPPNFQIIANNTKVFPARITGNKITGGKVEILLLESLGNSTYRVIAKPGLKLGDQLVLPGLDAKVIGVEDPERLLVFNQEESLLRTTLSTIGVMPTPPYIKKLLSDASLYQTIYAKYGFSAAAPTAGLHFTPNLLSKVKSKFPWHELTLNVGLGTFLPVKAEHINSHHMHKESYHITESTVHNLSATNKPILSIGTTTLRALESNPELIPGDHTTDIFIYPPYQFQLASALVTNFHLPGSTLLMLVSAFCSAPQTKCSFTTFKDSLLGEAYRLAVDQKYRFFSFGDAMLII